MFIDYYAILRIHDNANQSEIKIAFRNLAKEYHPDKNHSADAHEQFILIFEAYEVLKDPVSREKYDRFKMNCNILTKQHDFNEDFENHFHKENSRQKAEYYSNMSFDKFLETSIFVFKKATSKVAIIMIIIFGIIMIIFSFMMFAQIVDSNPLIGFSSLLFGLLIGGLLIKIGAKDF